MPKIKTHKGASKRFRKSKNIIKHRMCNRSHINSKMTAKTKRHLSKDSQVSKSDKTRIIRAIY